MIVQLPYNNLGYEAPGLTTVEYNQSPAPANTTIAGKVQGTADYLITPGAANQTAALASQPGVFANIMTDCLKTITLTGSQS